MFENKAKGWHGSYSVVGRNSAEKYPMILIKDKILKDQVEKRQIKDYFNTDDDIENNKIIIDDGEDIFNFTSFKKKKIKKKFPEICHHLKKDKIPDEYKYHQMHHKELFEINKSKQKNPGNLCMYLPKKDITWRRAVTGPNWDTITGRDKNSYIKETIGDKDARFYIDHNSYKIENRTFQMDKQTKRGLLPTFYDLRIRTDEPFYESTSKINKMKLNDSDTAESSKFDKSKTFFIKKDNYKSNHTLSFAKNLSREQYNYLHRDRRGVRPFFNPNYNLVEERSLSMVTYNRKIKSKPKTRRKKVFDSNLFFDPYECINKVNNHKVSNAPNLRVMVGRDDIDKGDKDSIHLPGHMRKNYNRNSLEVLTEKGLKMNNYIDSDFPNEFTSFCNKKSFNSIINKNLLRNNKPIKDSNIEILSKKMSTRERIKKLMEFYSINLDNQNLGDYYKKFDGITFKTIKNTAHLSEKEKKLFSLKFD